LILFLFANSKISSERSIPTPSASGILFKQDKRIQPLPVPKSKIRLGFNSIVALTKVSVAFLGIRQCSLT